MLISFRIIWRVIVSCTYYEFLGSYFCNELGMFKNTRIPCEKSLRTPMFRNTIVISYTI